MGVSLFWPWQGWLASLLERWLPDREESQVLIAEVAEPATEPTHARYLDDSALASADSAAQAVVLELQHLARLSLEVICHALYVPVDQLERSRQDERLLSAHPDSRALDAEQLYQRHIKGVYSDLLSFMSRLEVSLDEAHQHFWVSCQLAALQLVDAVKDAKHLQKNLGRYLRQDDSGARQTYVELRRHLLGVLHEVRELGRLELPDTLWEERLRQFDEGAAAFDSAFRQRLFAAVRERRLDGQQASSLMNDLGYVSRITQSLRNVLLLGQGDGNELFRPLRQLVAEDGPLIQLD
jgi:phosphate:Na+ symporter